MKYVNFCLIVLFSLALSSVSIKDTTPSIGYYPGEMIPDITLTGLEGQMRSLSDYRGKKVVMNFWASYDAQSRASNVRLHNYLKIKDADIVFLSISFDENIHIVERTAAMDNLDAISQFCEVNGTDSELFNDFKLNRGFRNYLIDENGVITVMNITPEYLESIL